MLMVQIIMWVFFIGPWLLLFAVDKERVKRYMAVSLFGVVLLTMFFKLQIALTGGK